MVTEQILEERRKEIPTIDELTTLLWTPEIGRRMALIRMKLMKDQKQLAQEFGVTQSTISRLEIGHLRVTEGITVSQLKKVFGNHFSFIITGTNPERYNAGRIVLVYWDTRLRVNRKNKGKYSKSRLLGLIR